MEVYGMISIQGNSGPMVLHYCLALATCIRFRHVLAKTKQKSPALKDTIRQKCLEYATNATVVLDYPG